MSDFGTELIGGFVFSSIGLVAFIYGKRMQVWRVMLLGLALMTYPYFVSSSVILYSLGGILTGALFLSRD